MLDAILRGSKSADIDWLHVQRALNRGLTRFLRVWMRLVLWVAPLFVILNAISVILTRRFGGQNLFFAALLPLLVAFLVGVGWLAWLFRAAFAQDRLAWRSGLLSWLALLLGAAVVAVFTTHPISRFDIFLNTGPVAWFALVGFVLLLSQEPHVIASLGYSRHPDRVRRMSDEWRDLDPSASAAVRPTLGMTWRGRLRSLAMTPWLLVSLYVIASVYSTAISLASGTFSAVPLATSAERYAEFGLGQFGPFGAGLGRGDGGFWSTAELVDLDQISRAPQLANAYLGMLWEGGFALLVGFLAFALVPAGYVFFSSRRRLKRLGPESRERAMELGRRNWSLALLGWVAALAVLPHSFMGLLTTGLLIVMVLGETYKGSLPAESAGRDESIGQIRRTRTWRITRRIPLVALRALVVALAIFGAVGAAGAYRAIVWAGPIDLRARASSLSGFDHWAIARTIGTEAVGAQNASGAQTAQIIQVARESYEAALAKLPRNLILAVEASQFYRLVAEDNEAASMAAEAGLAVDSTYVPLVLERAAQFAVAGQNEQALALLIPYANESATAAYQAAKLSLAAGNAEQAAPYYEEAIRQNPNHLQARFELAQALLALGRTADAEAQLDDLESRVAEDDFQTREAIKQLRKLIE